jgi:flagellar hook-associated protein 1 FlgK
MTGTFSGLSTALSALRYNRVAMDVASGNVSNVGTEGYARRTVVGQAQGAPDVPALWSRWDGAGNGVSVGGVERMTDALLDRRARTEHASQSFFDTRSASLVRVESTLGEPGDKGVSAALNAFQSSWQDLANNPEDAGARSQVVARANTLTSTINTQAANVTNEWSNQHSGLKVAAAEVTGLAADLAKVNEGLKVAAVSGTDPGLLLDSRDSLTMRLADLAGATTELQPDGTAKVTLDGKALVDGSRANQLTVGGGTTLGGGAVTMTVSGAVAPTGDVTIPRGSMGARLDLLNQTLPGHMAKLDAFAVEMAGKVNTIHEDGYDSAGQPGKAFFDGGPNGEPITAAGIRVAVTAEELAAAGSVELDGNGDPIPNYDGSNADRLGSEDIGAGSYRDLIAGFGIEVASARRVSENQSVLTSQIDASRESLSGINIDEEMVNLLAAQRAYEGAARVLTTLDSVLDTLINRTGITR